VPKGKIFIPFSALASRISLENKRKAYNRRAAFIKTFKFAFIIPGKGNYIFEKTEINNSFEKSHANFIPAGGKDTAIPGGILRCLLRIEP
jgi:hypothetical protein